MSYYVLSYKVHTCFFLLAYRNWKFISLCHISMGAAINSVKRTGHPQTDCLWRSAQPFQLRETLKQKKTVVVLAVQHCLNLSILVGAAPAIVTSTKFSSQRILWRKKGLPGDWLSMSLHHHLSVANFRQVSSLISESFPFGLGEISVCLEKWQKVTIEI